MAATAAPLYGSFDLGPDLGLSTLLDRLESISESFLGGQAFSAYLRTHEGQNHYGLEISDLREHEVVLANRLSSLSLYSSTEGGQGLNVQIRFDAKKAGFANGQYVIVGQDLRENAAIRNLLLDLDVELPEVWPVEDAEVSPETPDVEAEPTTEQSAPEEPADENERPQAEDEGRIVPIMSPPHEPEEKTRLGSEKSTFPVWETSFELGKFDAFDQLVDLVFDFFIDYFDDATFDIRLLTYSGDLRLGVRPDELRDHLQRYKGRLQKLFIVMTAADNRSVELMLAFEPETPSRIRAQTSFNETVEAQLYVPLQQLLKEHTPQTKPLFATPREWTRGTLPFQLSMFRPATLGSFLRKIERDLGSSWQLQLGLREGDRIPNFSLDKWEQIYERFHAQITTLNTQLSAPPHQVEISLDFRQQQVTYGLLLPTDADVTTFVEALGEALQSKVPSEGVALLALPEISTDLREYLPAHLRKGGYRVEWAPSPFDYHAQRRLRSLLDRARVVLLDLSERTPEVFLVLGAAMVLNKPLLLFAARPADIPFDLRTQRCIFFDAEQDTFSQLVEELEASLEAL